MTRRYAQWVSGEGVWIPRGILYVAAFLFLLWFASRIFVPPMWVVQQLDAPNGQRSARLLRSVYLRHHFVVKLKEGTFWQTAHYSKPLPGDLRVDLGERLRWAEDSSRVWLRVQGRPVWGYDFQRQRSMLPTELEQLPVGPEEP